MQAWGPPKKTPLNLSLCSYYVPKSVPLSRVESGRNIQWEFSCKDSKAKEEEERLFFSWQRLRQRRAKDSI